MPVAMQNSIYVEPSQMNLNLRRAPENQKYTTRV